MPPVIALALAGAGAYLAYRVVRREMTRVSQVMARSEAKTRQGVEIRLDRDPRTGTYRLPGDPGEG